MYIVDSLYSKEHSNYYQEKFEDTKGVIRIVNRRTDNIMAKEKDKQQSTKYYP